MLAPIALAIVGLLGIAMWVQTGDTRWVVGGALMLASAAASWLRTRGRGGQIASIILAILGIALMAIAFLRPAA